MNELEIVHRLANDYAGRYTAAEDETLHQINEETQQHPQARMLSGHVQGKFLSFISKILQPKYVLEIGTFTGYSALCLSEGMQADGGLRTIEIREDDANTATKNFLRAQKEKLIHLHLGNALDIIPTLPHLWDLVFIDADKTD